MHVLEHTDVIVAQGEGMGGVDEEGIGEPGVRIVMHGGGKEGVGIHDGSWVDRFAEERAPTVGPALRPGATPHPTAAGKEQGKGAA